MSGYGEKLCVTPIASFFGKRVVWIEFSPLDAVWGKFLGLPKWLYFNALKNVEMIITPTEYGKSGLVRGGLPAEKIHVIPCGRSLDALVQPAPMTEQLPSKKYVVCVSRFESGKGQDILLYAWAELLKKIETYTLVLVGSGSDEWQAYLENVVEQLNLGDSVIFAGRVGAVQPWMQNAEVVVFPSRWVLEGFGLVMIEAMAMGKTVVAFNHGPVPEVIENGKTGLLVDTTEQDAVMGLARRLEESLSSPKMRKDIGEAAQKAFAKSFQIEDIAVRYMEALK
jgi:glycosyltransferase involved in cell wall biosynthesis